MLLHLAREGDIAITRPRSQKNMSVLLGPLVGDMAALYAQLLRFHRFMLELQYLGTARMVEQDWRRFRQQLADESARRLQEFHALHSVPAYARMTLPEIARGYYQMHGGGTRFEAAFIDLCKHSHCKVGFGIVRDGLVIGYAMLCRASLRAQVEALYALRCSTLYRQLGVPPLDAGVDELNEATMAAITRSYESRILRATRRLAHARTMQNQIENLRRECEEEEALIAKIDTEMRGNDASAAAV